MPWKVLITHKIPKAGIDILRKNDLQIEILTSENKRSGRRLLDDQIGDADALLSLLTDTIDSHLIDRAAKLKIIANYAVGYNNIDVDACTRRGIAVSNTPGVLTETTADMAITLMLAVAKRIVEADAFTRRGLFRGWEPMLLLGADITSKILGIIGAGRIGRAVAKRAAGFDMKILYCDPLRNETIEKKYGAEKVTLKKLLRQSDYVTVHVPLNEATHHLLNEERLAWMKPAAFLINTSRGPLIDEQALLKALRRKKLAGAGLDVYENEPEITPGLTDLQNVVLLPHIASGTVETRDKMARMASENIIAMYKNQRPPNLINPEVLDKG